MNKADVSALFKELGGLDNVVGVGSGYKWVRGENTGQEATVVLVKKKQPKGELRRSAVIPKKIDGVVTDVIEVGDIRLQAVERTGLLRPACPGVSIGHYKVSAGTFGALVHDRSTGEPLILSNNHVLANQSNGNDDRASTGDAILQPGMFDGGDVKTTVIGHLKRFIPMQTEVNVPKCQIAIAFEKLINKCINIFRPQYRIQVLRENEQVNYVDCAVAAPLAADMISGDILEIGPAAGIKEAKPGMPVKKSGRSSGLTFSIVLATNVTIRIAVSNNENAVFADQILAGPMSIPGDSGSLVLTEDNYVVGLLFAGSDQATTFSRIDRVFDALNISL